MPEIKHQFTAGKMNKDLDERLVPNGEYRDAMNVQVSTSEGSEVGTVQNILGNSLVSGQDFIENDAYCVGSVADEKNDTLYYFIVNGQSSYKGDVIIQHNVKDNSISPVLVDTSGDVLNFKNGRTNDPTYYITGVNIIDGMLFWTDNYSEPKKINIPRSINGTNSGGLTHTDFINEKTSVSTPIEEKHITVIKQAPLSAPKIELISERDEDKTYTGVMRITGPFTGGNANNESSFNFSANQVQTRYDFSGLRIGDSFQTEIETDINGESDFTLEWNDGDTVLFKEFIDDQAPTLPITNYTIKARVAEKFNNSNENRFTDSRSEEAINGDFITPDATGTWPERFDASGGSAAGITYNSALNRVEWNFPTSSTTSWKVFKYIRDASNNQPNWDDGGTPKTYRVTVELSGVTEGQLRLYIVSSQTNNGGWNYAWKTGNMTTNGTHVFDITTDINVGATVHNWNQFAENFFFTNSSTSIGFVGNIDSVSIENLDATNARVRFEVLDIEGIPPIVQDGDTELKYAIDKQETGDKLYEFKFPRFATRYKYQDGEYSAFSPFTSVAFLPGSFDYDPIKGHNVGMTNRLNSVNVYPGTNIVPDGVTLIDVLYKEEKSPNVYVLDSIKQANWNSMYSVTSEAVNRAVPSNQLLRPWDNVPKKALAQDVTGSRIVYANYEQGYDLLDNSDNEYESNITVDFESETVGSKVKPSIKSSRDYQVGITFVDQYGRETPVVAGQVQNTSDAKRASKELADKANKISVVLNNNDFMKDAKFFKFFVKETSGEYYNMAMDRFWKAEDGHVWVSFPSSDVNKIDIDSYLILKKGIDSSSLVGDPARYKVIAIENEAPDFIKTKKTVIAENMHVESASSTDLFGSTLAGTPIPGVKEFKLKYEPFRNSSGSNLDLVDDGSVHYVEFTNLTSSSISQRYRISKIDTNWRHQTTSNPVYIIKLDKQLGDDVDFINDGTEILDNTIVRVYKYKKENSPEFDGRFFVKIVQDSIFKSNVSTNQSATDYKVVVSKKLYYLSPFTNHNAIHSAAITGLGNNAAIGEVANMYESTNTNGASNTFGRLAPFFRNYKYPPSSVEHNDDNGNPQPIGQYRFGLGDHWKNEFLDYTCGGANYWDGAWNNNPHYRQYTNLKQADKYPNQDPDEEEVWFIDAHKYFGSRSTNYNSLHWGYVSQSNGNKSGISNYAAGSPQATLSIAIGGIYHDDVSTSNEQSIDNFFNVGYDGGNSYYQDDATKSLVGQFNSSKKFRFRDDPEQTVYTVQSKVDSQLLRFNDGNPTDETQGHVSGVYPWSSGYSWNLQIAQLSPNFTRNWDLRVKNPNNDGQMNWVPTGTAGPITGGLEITIDHSAFAPTNTHGNLIVSVASPIGIDPTRGSWPIKEGMILVSHSDGGTTYDGTSNKEYLAIWKIEKQTATKYNIHLTGYSKLLQSTHLIFATAPTVSQSMVFKQAKMNGYSQFSANRINEQNAPTYGLTNPGLYALGYSIEFLEEVEADSVLPDNPAIWETEPKENTPLDVYYEASGLNPVKLEDDTKHLAIPIGSTVTHTGNSASISEGTLVASVGFIPYNEPMSANAQSGWYMILGSKIELPDPFVGAPYIVEQSTLRIAKPDGSSVNVVVTGWEGSDANATKFFIGEELYNKKYTLNWHNCFSFGNGVESNRIRDTFNLPFIDNGARVSTTLEDEEDYRLDRRKSGLIYSGLYNSIGGINNLNQFIAAEKITKDLNPVYGSIQKLHSRDSDLIALCEDKVVQILADKDAVFEADGSPQLTATNRVLGQSRPFVGEYGISSNPESFASESYRAYFTDKVRGAVMRLSKDGLTPISDAGMKDYFKDNLKNNDLLIGSYDDKKDEYNLTLPTTGTTVSFKEDIRGWVSFKSFVPDNAISCANDYFTLKDGKLYKHHDEGVDRNTFYDSFTESHVDVLLNDMPSSIKSYHTLDYEGSQSRVEGIKRVEVTGIEHADGSSIDGKYFFFEVSDMDALLDNSNWHTTTVEVKQYRNSILIRAGLVKIWDNTSSNSLFPASTSGGPTKGHGRYNTGTEPGDFEVGDVITTQLQEESIHAIGSNLFNSTPTDGWFVSNIETNKEKGSLSEFIEKEGKWFNYIKGVESAIGSDTDFGSFDIQGLGMVQGVDSNDITINGDLNASLQVGDIIYYEQPSQVLEDSILDMNVFSSGYNIDYYNLIGNTSMGSDQGFVIAADDTVVWNGLTDINVPSGINFFNNLTTEHLVVGETYFATLEVSDYNGTGSLGFSSSGGLGSTIRVDENDVDTNGDARVTKFFVASVAAKPDLFARDTNSGTMKASIQKAVTGGTFGFIRLESDQLQKAGVITGVNGNIITVDDSGTLPSESDYAMFVKNQVINMNGLSGYYASARFKNNSNIEAELFSVSSEITESSK
jgi:hypothetical protein